MTKRFLGGIAVASLVVFVGVVAFAPRVGHAIPFGEPPGEELNPFPAPDTCAGVPAVGQWVRVLPAEGLRVRSEPRIARETRIGNQPIGATGRVIAGPSFADNYCWVQVDYTNAPDGWSATDGLEVTTAPSGGGLPPPPPSGTPPPPPPPPSGGYTPSSVGGDVVPVSIQGGGQAPSRAEIDQVLSQVRSFFATASYGHFTPSLTVADPVTITIPAGGCGSREGSVAAMEAAAAAAGGGRIFIIPGCLSLENPDGRVVAGSLSAGTIAHEIGHSLSFAHAASAPGAAGGDTEDIMGNQFFGGGTLSGINIVHKAKANWLTDSNIQPVTQSGSYSLVPHDVSSQPSGVAAIRIPVSGQSYNYWLSRRGSGGVSIRSDEAVGGVTGTDSALIDPSVAASHGVTVSGSGGQVQVTISGSGTPPPPGGGGSGACPGRSCEPLVNTEFGSYALTCPTTPVQIARNGLGRVPMMAIGTYAAGGAPVTVPVRGGSRFTPNIGIRSASELGTYSPTLLSPGGILDFEISVSPEVPVGTYSVPLRATLTDYEPDPLSSTREPRLAEKYSYCNLPLQVTAAGAQPSSFGRIYSFVGAGTPISDMRVQPGQTVQIHWSSAGASACYLKVNNQSRVLPSGSDGTRGGSFTSDPARTGAIDTYELKCQVSGAPPGEFTAPAYFTLGPAGGVAPAPGELVITLDAQGDSGTFYGTVPKDEFGRVIDFVHVRSGGMVTFYWTSQNTASCSVSPTGATTLSGGSGVSGIVTPLDIRVTCTGTSGEVKSKSVRVVMNPGEPVTGQPPSGSLSCDPFRKGYNPGSTFSIRTRTTGATGNLNFEVSMINPADNPIIDVVSNLTNRPAGENTIDFRMRPLIGGKNSATIMITITAKESGGGTVGSCLTIADVGAYPAGSPPADQQTLQQQQYSGGTVPPPFTGSFSTGNPVRATDGVRVRADAAGLTLGLQAAGAFGTVSGPSISTPEREWTPVNFSSGPDGFVATEFLSLVGGAPQSGGNVNVNTSGGNAATGSGNAPSSGTTGGGQAGQPPAPLTSPPGFLQPPPPPPSTTPPPSTPPPPLPPPPPVTVTSGTSVQVVSPNGGEVWTVGSGRTIQWNVVNPPLGFSASIDLVDASGNVVSAIAPKTNAAAGVNSYGWIVPSSVSQGSYRVRVTCRDGASCSDSSDGTFTIAKSGSGSNSNAAVLSQTALVLEAVEGLLRLLGNQ